MPLETTDRSYEYSIIMEAAAGGGDGVRVRVRVMQYVRVVRKWE